MTNRGYKAVVVGGEGGSSPYLLKLGVGRWGGEEW